MIHTIIVIECVLFIWGFVYALTGGNPDWPWWRRGLAGGVFFALFYIFIPLVMWEDKYR